MRILTFILLVCCSTLSTGAIAASVTNKGAQSTVDVQQTTEIPTPNKAPHSRKSKADVITQPDPAPSPARDKSGRFVKKGHTLSVPEQRSAPTSPVVPKTAEPGATARCQDGTFSHSKQHSGSCSRHGGVAQWLAE